MIWLFAFFQPPPRNNPAFRIGLPQFPKEFDYDGLHFHLINTPKTFPDFCEIFLIKGILIISQGPKFQP